MYILIKSKTFNYFIMSFRKVQCLKLHGGSPRYGQPPSQFHFLPVSTRSLHLPLGLETQDSTFKLSLSLTYIVLPDQWSLTDQCPDQ